MSELQIFKNGDFSVRTIEDNGEIWFVAKDVAQALGYPEASNAARLFQSVPEFWKGVKPIHTLGGEQEMLCLSEQGLYFFLGRSDKKAALPYQMWIAGEVVPSIRKTGSYTLPQKDHVSRGIMNSAAKIFDRAFDCKDEKDYKITLALDKIFKDFTGKSALETAGIKLKKTEKVISHTVHSLWGPEYDDICWDELKTEYSWESDLLEKN